MELVRKLLHDIANGEFNKVSFVLSSFGEESDRVKEDKKYAYHLKIMRQAGLITYEEQEHKGGMRLFELPELTWVGQDYYGAIQSDTIWSKTKEAVTSSGMKLGNVAFDTLILMAKVKAKEVLGLPME